MTAKKHPRIVGTSRGIPLTDDDIQRLADEAETGYDPSRLRPRGDRRTLGPNVEIRLNEAWNNGQARWRELSSSAQLVAVDDAGHYIHIDQPALVIDQVQQLLDS